VAKVVIRKLSTKSGKPRKSGVVKKRVIGPTGSMVTIRSVDANSATFTSDFETVFKKNVAKARRENKKMSFSADRDR
jgi:hypothetical protein